MLPKTSIKFVPAEYHSQSAIAAAFDLRRQIGDPKRIRDLEIATFRTAVEIIGKDPEKWRPKTRETADHSLPYCTAVALVDGKVSVGTIHPRTNARTRPPRPGRAHESRRRPEAHSRLSRGHSKPCDRDPGRRPEARRPGHIPPGHDRNPLSDEQLAVKFHELADPVLGSARANQILERVARLADDPNPHETLELTAIGQASA